MIALVLAAYAAPLDPVLEGAPLPADADVQIERRDTSWTVTVGGRPMLVPAPQTPADEEAIRALVQSLLSGLELVPSSPLPRVPPAPAPAPRTDPPAPQPVVIVVPTILTAAPLPPAPPPAPPASVPSPVVAPPVLPEEPEPGVPRLWIGPEVVARAGVAAGAGGAVGVWFGHRGGAGFRVAGRLPRTVAVGGSPSLAELDADLELWGAATPWVTLVMAGGASGRRYAVGDAPIAVHVMPRAAAGVVVPVVTRRVSMGFGAALELDLGETRIGSAGAEERISPAALRIELRFSDSGEPIAR